MGFHDAGEWWQIGNKMFAEEGAGFPCCDVCFDGILDCMGPYGSAGMWRVAEDGCVLCSKCDRLNRDAEEAPAEVRQES